jgi:hypothetical protein
MYLLVFILLKRINSVTVRLPNARPLSVSYLWIIIILLEEFLKWTVVQESERTSEMPSLCRAVQSRHCSQRLNFDPESWRDQISIPATKSQRKAIFARLIFQSQTPPNYALIGSTSRYKIGLLTLQNKNNIIHRNPLSFELSMLFIPRVLTWNKDKKKLISRYILIKQNYIIQ